MSPEPTLFFCTGCGDVTQGASGLLGALCGSGGLRLATDAEAEAAGFCPTPTAEELEGAFAVEEHDCHLHGFEGLADPQDCPGCQAEEAEAERRDRRRY